MESHEMRELILEDLKDMVYIVLESPEGISSIMPYNVDCMDIDEQDKQLLASAMWKMASMTVAVVKKYTTG